MIHARSVACQKNRCQTRNGIRKIPPAPPVFPHGLTQLIHREQMAAEGYARGTFPSTIRRNQNSMYELLPICRYELNRPVFPGGSNMREDGA